MLIEMNAGSPIGAALRPAPSQGEKRRDPFSLIPLKLTAPSCCGSLLFVKTLASRRRLGAIR